jgi:hypothetical protein
VTTDAAEFERLLRSGPFDVVAFEALLDNLPPLHHPNDPQELRAVLHPLKSVLRRTGVTGCATLHTIKARALDFRSKMAGSHQFNAVARSGLLVAHHPNGSARRVLIGGKANYTAGAVPLSFAIRGHLFELNGRDFDQPLATDFAEEPDLTMEDVLGGPPGKRERQQTERTDLVLSALTGTPQSVRTVAASVELSTATTGRYLADLVDDGLATKTPKGFVRATARESMDGSPQEAA